MRRRRPSDEVLFSLDSFLDIVTNVVGVLVLVAMVTAVSAHDISVPSGATAMTAPRPSAQRLIFEIAGDEVYFVDEEGDGERVLDAVQRAGKRAASREGLVALLEGEDVGDATHRVLATPIDRGLAWDYALRPEARGERADALDRPDSAFRQRLAGIERGGFAYFVVHDDGFETFHKARDVARELGVKVGWHPVEGREPIRLSAIGSLGKRIQ